MSPSISVLVRAYNEEKHIGRLLTGIQRQNVRDAQVVLVDSGSTDATLSIASRFGVEVVHIVPEMFSFGRALNMGFERCRGDVVVMASAHVYPVYDDWIERLTEPLKDERVALVFGRQRGDDRTKFSERQVFASWYPEVTDLDQASPFCNNANAAIRRSEWERRPYDETLTGLEDLDWAKRARAAGLRIAYVAEAEIVHVHEESWPQIRNRYRREAMALKTIFPNEHFDVIDFARLTVSNVVTDLSRAARQGAVAREAADIVAFRLMQFWGTYRGFRSRGPVTAHLRERFYYPDRGSTEPPPDRQRGQPIDYRSESPGMTREWKS